MVDCEAGAIFDVWLEERLEDIGGSSTVEVSGEMVEKVAEFGNGLESRVKPREVQAVLVVVGLCLGKFDLVWCRSSGRRGS